MEPWEEFSAPAAQSSGSTASTHRSASRSRVKMALDGLVEGHFTASLPVYSRQYFW